MPIKRNYLIKVFDAKIVDVKRALEAKGIKLESIYEMYKETREPEKVAAPSVNPPQKPPTPAAPSSTGTPQDKPSSEKAAPPKSATDKKIQVFLHQQHHL